jgi:hypothetical protein
LDTEIAGSTPAMPTSMLILLLCLAGWSLMGVLSVFIYEFIQYVRDEDFDIRVGDIIVGAAYGLVASVIIAMMICENLNIDRWWECFKADLREKREMIFNKKIIFIKSKNENV